VFEFAFQAGMAGRRDVVARPRRELERRRDFVVIVAVAFPDEGAAHQ
jgi:hypothetical protein